MTIGFRRWLFIEWLFMGLWRRSSFFGRFGLATVIAVFAVIAILLPLWSWLALTEHAASEDFDTVVGWANILAYSAGMIGIAFTVTDRYRARSRSTHRSLDEAADLLMHQVLTVEAGSRARLLGTGHCGTAAANLSFREARRPATIAPAAEPRLGRFTGIGGYFTEHTDRRLVVLGGPGSGKTVLAIELLIQLAEERAATTDRVHRMCLPVPVRFSLPAWNTDQPLATWLATEIAARFGLQPALATTLVTSHRILPILDGLDEMDPAEAAPIRAAAAVGQLNEHLSGRLGVPLVVTCRTEEYQRLRTESRIVVRPATEVTIEQLTAEQVRDYLHNEYDNSADWELAEHWAPVLSRLGDRPDQRVLEALGTPWQLTMAVGYHRNGGDPRALLPTPAECQQHWPDQHGDSAPATAPAGSPAASRTAQPAVSPAPKTYHDRVRSLLLASYIPARTAMYGRNRYTSDQVTRWCRTLAQRLGTGTELVPHTWWRVADRARVRRWHAAAVVAFGMAHLAVALLVGDDLVFAARVAVQVWHPTPGSGPGDVLAAGALLAWLGFLFGGFVLLGVRQTGKAGLRPSRVNPRQLRTSAGRRQLLCGVLTGLVLSVGAAPLFAMALGTRAGLVDGLKFVLSFGLAGGFALGLRPMCQWPNGPQDSLRADRTVLLTIGAIFAIGFSLPAGIASAIGAGPVAGLAAVPQELLPEFFSGLTGALAFGVAGHAWLRHLVAVNLMASSDGLPRRFDDFLGWANRAGILRVSGGAYQFRHRELQSWLRGPATRVVPPRPGRATGNAVRWTDQNTNSGPAELADQRRGQATGRSPGRG